MPTFSRTTHIHILLGIIVASVALWPTVMASGEGPSELVVGEIYQGVTLNCANEENANALAEVVATERSAPGSEMTFCNHSFVRFRVVRLVKLHARNGNVANVVETRITRTGETLYIVSDMPVVERQKRT